jgi:hypothetical protein
VGTLLGQRFASGELTREELFITTKLAHPPRRRTSTSRIGAPGTPTRSIRHRAEGARRHGRHPRRPRPRLRRPAADALARRLRAAHQQRPRTSRARPRHHLAHLLRARRQGRRARHRRVQLHHHPPAPADGGHPRARSAAHRQPDGDPSLLPRPRAGDLLPRAGHRGHRLRALRQRRLRHAARPRADRHRQTPRQDPRPGGAALARAERAHGLAQDLEGQRMAENRAIYDFALSDDEMRPSTPSAPARRAAPARTSTPSRSGSAYR